jgi:hypothetical protein
LICSEPVFAQEKERLTRLALTSANPSPAISPSRQAYGAEPEAIPFLTKDLVLPAQPLQLGGDIVSSTST